MTNREPGESIEGMSLSTASVHQKGWGSEVWLVNNSKYCGKLLNFNAGASFSMHYHMEKHETFYVLKGKLKLDHIDLGTATPQSTTLNQGDVLTIPAGNPHKITALEESVIIEISTTHYESDSYRIQPGDSQKK